MFWEAYDDQDGYQMWLSESEVQDLISHAPSDKAELAIQMGVRCGLRSDEIVRISPEDVVNTEAGWVLRVEGAKTGELRQTPAPEVVAGMLRAYGSGQDGHEPVIDVTTRTIRSWVKTAAQSLKEETGDEMWEYVSPHDLRRTWATNVEGADVETLILMDWGGWNDVETFLNHYRGTFSPDVQAAQREKVDWL
jgi:integrase